MKRVLVALLILCFLTVGNIPVVIFAADVSIANGEPATQAIRKFSATGSTAIASSVSISPSGTEVWEIISMDLHLSAAGGAANLTVTKNSVLGSGYDTVLLTQDMTSVVDLYQVYDQGEMLLDNGDTYDIAWANGSGRTYGLTVLYRLK